MSKKNIDPEFNDVYRFPFGKIILTIIILVVIGSCVTIVWQNKYYEYVIKYFSIAEDENEEEVKDSIPDKKDNLIYFYDSEEGVINSSVKLPNKELKSTYLCKSRECEVNTLNDYYALITDDNNYLYSINNLDEIKLEINLKDISDLYIINDKDTLYGIVYKNNKLYFYSTKENKNVYNSTMWSYDPKTNYIDKGYLIFKSNGSGALFDLNTYKTKSTSIVDGFYSLYNNYPVIVKDDKYFVLDGKLNKVNKSLSYIRSTDKENVVYLFNDEKSYNTCYLDKGQCVLNKSSNIIYDIINNKYIVLKNGTLYFADKDNKLGDSILDIKDYIYINNNSFYLEKDEKEMKKGLYLSFYVGDKKDSYERWYFGNGTTLISKSIVK